MSRYAGQIPEELRVFKKAVTDRVLDDLKWMQEFGTVALQESDENFYTLAIWHCRGVDVEIQAEHMSQWEAWFEYRDRGKTVANIAYIEEYLGIEVALGGGRYPVSLNYDSIDRASQELSGRLQQLPHNVFTNDPEFVAKYRAWAIPAGFIPKWRPE